MHIFCLPDGTVISPKGRGYVSFFFSKCHTSQSHLVAGAEELAMEGKPAAAPPAGLDRHD